MVQRLQLRSQTDGQSEVGECLELGGGALAGAASNGFEDGVLVLVGLREVEQTPHGFLQWKVAAQSATAIGVFENCEGLELTSELLMSNSLVIVSMNAFWRG